MTFEFLTTILSQRVGIGICDKLAGQTYRVIT
jgi:hypothetical protein